MGRKYNVISGDGHLETPPDFVKFVPEKWKERAPRLIRLPDGGGDAWMMEGMPLTYASQNLKGRGTVKFAGQSYFHADGSRAEGTGDGVQRLQEQDEDGIDAEILFAPVFAARFIEKIPERDVYMSMIQAYNTWLAEDYTAPGYGPGEVHTPLDYAPTPTSLARRWFTDAAIARDLAALERGQGADGGWRFTWREWNAATTLAWRGVVTIRALTLLRAYGRLPDA